MKYISLTSLSLLLLLLSACGTEPVDGDDELLPDPTPVPIIEGGQAARPVQTGPDGAIRG